MVKKKDFLKAINLYLGNKTIFRYASPITTKEVAANIFPWLRP